MAPPKVRDGSVNGGAPAIRAGGKKWRRGGGFPTHPYLARQMSDFGFRKPLIGLNSGVRAEISTYPACLLAILLGLARRAQRGKETQQL